MILEDAEGTPVAALTLDAAGLRHVEPRARFSHPPLRSRRRTPGQLTPQLPDAPYAVAVTEPLTAGQVRAVAAAAGQAGVSLLWIVVIGAGRTPHPEALTRAVDEIAAQTGGVVVPVAIPAGYDELLGPVALAYGAARLLDPPQPSATDTPHPAFAARPTPAAAAPRQRGVTVFFTGLSGSGKSTVAKALAERLLTDGRRTVTMLDGDEVRRLLSAGLGFSRADRELNIRRIGFVAAEVTRHGGLAICAPIAPFAAGRAQVRAMVEQAGGQLLLVHVATPLAECERRDRKGLYAKARRGEIPDFTGISSPYETPTDADLTLDTTGMPVAHCVDLLWQTLEEGAWIRP